MVQPILDTVHGRNILLQQEWKAAAASLTMTETRTEQIQQTEKLLGDGNEDTALCEL